MLRAGQICNLHMSWIWNQAEEAKCTMLDCIYLTFNENFHFTDLTLSLSDLTWTQSNTRLRTARLKSALDTCLPSIDSHELKETRRVSRSNHLAWSLWMVNYPKGGISIHKIIQGLPWLCKHIQRYARDDSLPTHRIIKHASSACYLLILWGFMSDHLKIRTVLSGLAASNLKVLILMEGYTH